MSIVETPTSSPRRAAAGPMRRFALAALSGGLLAGGALLTLPGVASATPAHTDCAATAAGQSSGWCGLYPGNAVHNVKALGQVSVSADGTSLTVATQDAATGAAPDTSFACLVPTAAADITHRLQDTQCSDAGGVWLPFGGGSLTVDLTAYPQFLNGTLTVQVAASPNAKNSNGDAFYNNFTASTVPSGGNPG